MDIFKILQEAKNPSSQTTNINPSAGRSIDYTAEVDTGADTQQDTQADAGDDQDVDYTEGLGADDQQDNAGQDDAGGGDQNADDGGDVDYTDGLDDMSGGDDSSGGDTSGGDSYSQDEQDVANMSPEEKEDIKKNALLIKNAISLFYSIKNTVDKLNKVSDINIMKNKVYIQVKNNLSDLSEQTYDFITTVFSTKSYVENLYIYNYIIEAYKINIEMLRKNDQFEC